MGAARGTGVHADTRIQDGQPRDLRAHQAREWEVSSQWSLAITQQSPCRTKWQSWGCSSAADLQESLAEGTAASDWQEGCSYEPCCFERKPFLLETPFRVTWDEVEALVCSPGRWPLSPHISQGKCNCASQWPGSWGILWRIEVPCT